MRLDRAKSKLDTVIRKSRVHFYKPFQVAEILRRHRTGEIVDLSDLESYRNPSTRWRNEVSSILVGRISTSSARFQHNIFDENGCPPEALVALGLHNKATHGEVEAYIYRTFEEKVSALSRILEQVQSATPATFELGDVIHSFEMKPGLKRSIDKVYEITVFALFAALVRALRLRVSVKMDQVDPTLVKEFGGFLEKVVGIPRGSDSVTVDAQLCRLGATNAADRGLDIVANFGPAVQVKHLTLDAEAIADICDDLSFDRVVVVCKDTEVTTVDAVVAQLGLGDRLQGVITFSDLEQWYRLCMGEDHGATLGVALLKDFCREFESEFPSTGGLEAFLTTRGYAAHRFSPAWEIGTA